MHLWFSDLKNLILLILSFYLFFSFYIYFLSICCNRGLHSHTKLVAVFFRLSLSSVYKLSFVLCWILFGCFSCSSTIIQNDVTSLTDLFTFVLLTSTSIWNSLVLPYTSADRQKIHPNQCTSSPFPSETTGDILLMWLKPLEHQILAVFSVRVGLVTGPAPLIERILLHEMVSGVHASGIGQVSGEPWSTKHHRVPSLVPGSKCLFLCLGLVVLMACICIYLLDVASDWQ